MKRLAIVMLLLLSIPVIAQYDKKPRIISRSGQVFDNAANCADTNTCDLLQVRYKAEDYEIWVGDSMHYGTRLFAHYRTRNLETLENYAFVQFVKGCQYWSDNTGEVVFVGTYNFSKQTLFNYKDWVIDSSDTDPVYFSTPDSRHFNYKWNTRANSVDRATERYFGLDKPTQPELYISDIPYTAFYMNSSAKNLSLAFKTCLYRTSDVPVETTPDNVNFAEPLYCFYWYSSWIYDHDLEQFTNPYNISPACLK